MTTETNQTAVNWVINELLEKGDAWTNVSISKIQISIDEDEYINLLKQAKEIEKQQITDAYHFGISDEYVITAEHYYNKTFGGKDEQ